MKIIVKTSHLIVVCALAVLAMTGEADAYFDPGTGSMLLQAMAAGLMAAAVFWRRIRDILHNLFQRKNKTRES